MDFLFLLGKQAIIYRGLSRVPSARALIRRTQYRLPILVTLTAPPCLSMMAASGLESEAIAQRRQTRQCFALVAQ